MIEIGDRLLLRYGEKITINEIKIHKTRLETQIKVSEDGKTWYRVQFFEVEKRDVNNEEKDKN